MRVSERITKFWAAALTIAVAGFSFQSAAVGQIVKAAQSSEIAASRPNIPATGNVAQWLGQARTAMSEGNLKLADHYIQIAEQLQRQSRLHFGRSAIDRGRCTCHTKQISRQYRVDTIGARCREWAGRRARTRGQIGTGGP